MTTSDSNIPAAKTNRGQRITAALEEAFAPEHLEVIDESHLHHGHMGWSPEGETHYRVRLNATVFTGLSRVQQHRKVNAALKDEFDRGLHALALEIGA